MVKDVAHPVLHVGHFLGTVIVGVAEGQQVPTQPSVTVFKRMQSSCGPQLSLGQKIPFGAVAVTVGHARVVTWGHVPVVSARQGQRRLAGFSM